MSRILDNICKFHSVFGMEMGSLSFTGQVKPGQLLQRPSRWLTGRNLRCCRRCRSILRRICLVCLGRARGRTTAGSLWVPPAPAPPSTRTPTPPPPGTPSYGGPRSGSYSRPTSPRQVRKSAAQLGTGHPCCVTGIHLLRRISGACCGDGIGKYRRKHYCLKGCLE